MGTTDSSSLSKKRLFCPVRSLWVASTPEEQVRQGLIAQLTRQLSYPIDFIVAEKEIAQLPHLFMQGARFPKRRIDLLCYTQAGENLSPLLLVEVKAGPFRSADIRQLGGYNALIQANYFALVSPHQLFFGGSGLRPTPLDALPPYSVTKEKKVVEWYNEGQRLKGCNGKKSRA